MNIFSHKIKKNGREFSGKAVFSASVIFVLKSVSIYSTDKYYGKKMKILPIVRQNTTARRYKNYRIFKNSYIYHHFNVRLTFFFLKCGKFRT
jgi:hypothetical protein